MASAHENDKAYQQQLLNQDAESSVAFDLRDGADSIKNGIKKSATEFKNGVKEICEAVSDKLSSNN